MTVEAGAAMDRLHTWPCSTIGCSHTGVAAGTLPPSLFVLLSSSVKWVDSDLYLVWLL